MKRNLALMAVALFCCNSLCAQNDGEEILNVTSYNIRNGLGMDGVTDISRVAAVIADAGADIVGVQEVDSVTRRSGGRYVLDDIAKEVAMHPIYAPAIDFDGGKYGIGLLCREKPLATRRVPLPGREEARVLLIAEFEKFFVGNVHLSLTEEDALASVDIIAREAAACGKPFIVMGDWNSSPGSAVVEKMKASGFRLISGEVTPTWPADAPQECIDYIAVYGDAEGLGAAVGDEAMASDHRPVYARLRLN